MQLAARTVQSSCGSFARSHTGCGDRGIYDFDWDAISEGGIPCLCFTIPKTTKHRGAQKLYWSSPGAGNDSIMSNANITPAQNALMLRTFP